VNCQRVERTTTRGYGVKSRSGPDLFAKRRFDQDQSPRARRKHDGSRKAKGATHAYGYDRRPRHGCRVRHFRRHIVLGGPAHARGDQVGSAAALSPGPMSAQSRPPIRHCPLCGIAMVSSKSDEQSAQFDTFSCLNCKTVISLAPPPKSPKPNR